MPALFATGVLLYFLYAALHYVLLSLEATREAESREAEMQILAREAELAALKAQIQPHFLFNSLNSISSLAASDPPRAQEMCVRLSEFLRKSLALGETRSIPMGEELALSRAYLSVEELRYGPRLVFEEDLDERSGRCQVPPLLLQPLVENAIRHGIATCVDGGTVRLAVRFAAGRLRILVENPYDPESPARAGVGLGLANVRQRLAARYGGEALFAAKRLKRPLPRRDLGAGGAARVTPAPRPAAEIRALIVDDEAPARRILRELSRAACPASRSSGSAPTASRR